MDRHFLKARDCLKPSYINAKASEAMEIPPQIQNFSQTTFIYGKLA